MLLCYMRYYHTDYTHWGSRYVSEMYQLPEEVRAEFENRNFVVKHAKQKINQVLPDQSSVEQGRKVGVSLA